MSVHLHSAPVGAPQRRGSEQPSWPQQQTAARGAAATIRVYMGAPGHRSARLCLCREPPCRRRRRRPPRCLHWTLLGCAPCRMDSGRLRRGCHGTLAGCEQGHRDRSWNPPRHAMRCRHPGYHPPVSLATPDANFQRIGLPLGFIHEL